MLKQVKLHAKNARWSIDLALLTFVIGAIYFLLLGYPPLAVPDEARYSEIPREMLILHDFITPHLNFIKYFEKPPLFYWLQTLSIQFFGFEELSLRLVTMLMGISGCLLSYSAARVLFNRNTGILSAIVLASSFLYYGMSHLITLDMTFSTFIAGTLFAFLLAVNSEKQSSRRGFITLAAISCACAVLTKGLAGLILPSMVIFSWLLLFNQWQQLKTLFLPGAVIIFLIIAAPWHILIQQKNPEFFHYYFITQQFSRYFTLSAGRYQPNWFFIPILLAGIMPWTGFLLQTLWHHASNVKRELTQHKNTGFLLLWAILIFIFFSVSHSKLIPYIIPVFPPLAILIASYLTLEKRKGFLVGVIVFIILASCLATAAIIGQPYLPASTAVSIRLNALAFILILGAATAALYCLQLKKNKCLAAMVATCVLAYPILNTTIPHVDDRSIKKLAINLRPHLKPGDIIVNYKHYYQDLPFYLGQETLIADWRNELEFGATHQADGPERLISSAQFITLWRSEKTVYAVTRTPYYDDLLEQYPNMQFYLLAQTNSNALLSNKDPGT